MARLKIWGTHYSRLRMAFRWSACALTTLAVSTPASAGGGGAITILRSHGTVMVREIDFTTGKPRGRWHAAKRGTLDGSFQIRTSAGAWAHVNLPFKVNQGGAYRYLRGGCIDSQSLIRIDSYADSSMVALRGKVSLLDGKRSGSLPNHMGE